MRCSEGKNSNWTMLKDQRKIDIENVSGKIRLMYEDFDFEEICAKFWKKLYGFDFMRMFILKLLF